MALTKEQIDKYGLSQVDNGSIDDGVIESGGNYYKLNNFERQQNDKLDSDQGDVFGSSLEKDSGVDYSNFNTINDVQGAVRAMEGNATEDPKPVKYSPELQDAHDRVDAYVKRSHSGELSSDIFDGGYKKSITRGGYDDANTQQKKAAQVFADGFVDKVKRNITTEVGELNS